MTHGEKLLTVKEVAGLIRVSVATIWRNVKSDTLPGPIRIGGRTLWVEPEILAMIEKKKAARHMPSPAAGPLPRLWRTRTKKGRLRVRLEEAA